MVALMLGKLFPVGSFFLLLKVLVLSVKVGSGLLARSWHLVWFLAAFWPVS